MINMDNIVRAASADTFAILMRESADAIEDRITCVGVAMEVVNPVLNGVADGCDNDARDTRNLLLDSSRDGVDEADRLRKFEKAIRDMLLSAAVAGFVMGATTKWAWDAGGALFAEANAHGSHDPHPSPDGE